MSIHRQIKRPMDLIEPDGETSSSNRSFIGSAPPANIAAFQETSAVLASIDLEGTILDCTRGFAALLGVDREALIDASLDQHRGQLGLAPWMAVCGRILRDGPCDASRLMLDPYGNRIDWALSLYPVTGEDGQISSVLLVGLDLADVKEARSRLEVQAYEDPLTGLFNRRYLESIIEEMLVGVEKVGFIVIDLDGFKQINDTYGHEIGDQVLQHIAHSLRDAAQLGDIVVRLGGDEFVIVVQHDATEEAMKLASEVIAQAVSRPFAVGRVTHRVHASIGTSLFPQDGLSLKPLLLKADTRMYQAKHGRPVNEGLASSPILKAMGEAIRHDHITPAYQPIVDLSTNRVIAVEALSRWDHPTLGTLMPGDFIPAAEASGMIPDLDKAIFMQVCRDLARSDGPFGPDQTVFANLSTVTLGSTDLRQFLEMALDRYGLDPSRFCIELSESMELNEADPGREVVFELAELGFDIALDDFGTGFSSLALLKGLPVSWIKVDKSFVQDICRSRRDQRIVESVQILSESLGSKLIAEGIEDRDQLAILDTIGVPYGQGFLFRQPERREDIHGINEPLTV